jgi:regulator of protease activity HflC (stomatin/prohibitin superfamily)
MNIEAVFTGLATVGWILVFVLGGLAMLRVSRRQKVQATSTALIVVLVATVLVTILGMGIVFINPQERGVVISAVTPGGLRLQPLEPGLRWIIPFVERVERYSIASNNYTMSIAPLEGEIQGDDSVTARTSDGQEIFVDASIIFSVDPAKVVQVHIVWQDRYTDELIRPQVRGVIRDAVSQYGVEEVITTKRFDMVNKIEQALGEKLSENGLILQDFVLRNITFSTEYAASVEQKQIAEQQAQQAALVVEQRRQEAEQARQVAQGQADAVVIQAQGAAEARVIQAQAEAEALRLLAEALSDNPDLLTYQYINKIAPGVEVMLVPNDQPYILPLPTLENQFQVPDATVP